MSEEKIIDVGNTRFWISEAEKYYGEGVLKVQQSGGAVFLIQKNLREALKKYFKEENDKTE